MGLITLELLSEANIDAVRKIQRDDISEAFADSADPIMERTQYGLAHNCKTAVMEGNDDHYLRYPNEGLLRGTQ